MSVLRNEDEIETIQKAGSILAAALETVKRYAKRGIRTNDLDIIARDEILKHGGYPAFKDYRGFPGNICTSINEVVVHGIPSPRKLENGDIISIDVGVKFRGYFADAAITVGIGGISDQAKKLIEVAERALRAGIENALADKRVSDISCSIQELVEANGFSVVRAFVGHGIGTELHEKPEIPNFGVRGTGIRLKKGMVLAIEPMINAGTYEVEVGEDGWTAVTKDRKLSAHFEHTIVVRDGGAEILTE